MKNTLLIISLNFICFSLFAQTENVDTSSCINFDDYNFCYSVDYRPRDEKVGTICSFKDLMLNPNVEITNAAIYVTANGEFLPISNLNNDDKYLLNVLKRLLSGDRNLDNAFISFNIKIMLDGKETNYPRISLKKCPTE